MSKGRELDARRALRGVDPEWRCQERRGDDGAKDGSDSFFFFFFVFLVLVFLSVVLSVLVVVFSSSSSSSSFFFSSSSSSSKSRGHPGLDAADLRVGAGAGVGQRAFVGVLRPPPPPQPPGAPALPGPARLPVGPVGPGRRRAHLRFAKSHGAPVCERLVANPDGDPQQHPQHHHPHRRRRRRRYAVALAPPGLRGFGSQPFLRPPDQLLPGRVRGLLLHRAP
eukprot:gi/632953586/ref/XP_007892499.1/ PREDICTED: uncharacterized protein LOC103179176 [Callorhinchus milii]